jgi:hypothetical protein
LRLDWLTAGPGRPKRRVDQNSFAHQTLIESIKILLCDYTMVAAVIISRLLEMTVGYVTYRSNIAFTAARAFSLVGTAAILTQMYPWLCLLYSMPFKTSQQWKDFCEGLI